VGLLTRYLLARLAGPLPVALLLICALIWLLQALRLGHHLVGAGLGPAEVGRTLLYSLPALLVFALPLALAAAILHGTGRLAETNELSTLRARGASPLQLCLPAVFLALACAAVAALLALFVEAPALGRLRQGLLSGAARALVLAPEARRFHRIGKEATLYVDRARSPQDGRGRFGGLLLALEPARSDRSPAREAAPVVLLAREASVSLTRGGQVAKLVLKQGELQLLDAQGRLHRARFDRLEHRLELTRALGPHFAFLTALQRDRWRALTAPAACLALGLLATAIGLGRGSRLRLALLGLAGVGLYQLAVGLVGQLSTAPAGRAWGAVAVSAAVVLGSLGWISRRSRRR